MENRKPFNPMEIDESLTRLVTHGGHVHLLFPYIDATGVTPKFGSVGLVIKGPAATAQDFSLLSTHAKRAANGGEWFMSFNTPWLVTSQEAESIRQRRYVVSAKRVD